MPAPIALSFRGRFFNPSDAQVHNNLGVLLAQQGRVDEAIPHFSFAVQQRPNFAIWRRNLETALADKARRIGSPPPAPPGP